MFAKQYRTKNIKYFNSNTIELDIKDNIIFDIYIFIDCIKKIVDLKNICLVQLNIR